MGKFFLNLKKIFLQLDEKKLKKIRKYVFLGIALISAFMTALLLFVPFCLYVIDENAVLFSKLVPIKAFSLLKDELSVLDGVAYAALGLFIAITVCIAIVIAILIKAIRHTFNDETKLIKTTKSLVIFSSILTGVYYFGGMIACVIIRGQGGKVLVAANLYPFIIMISVAVVYAILAGVLFKKKEKSLEEKAKEDKRQKMIKDRVAVYKARIELFIATLIIVALAVLAMLSNIVTITYVDALEYMDPVNISGIELIKDYLELDEGGQLVAFILFFALVLVATIWFLSLVAFLSRSNLFYKVSLAVISISVVVTFLVGMFGKYYQVVQKLNEGMLSKYIEELIGFTGEININYQIESSSLYYFIGSIAVITVLLLRNPYTRGIALEKEIALRRESENPHTIKGEVSLTDVPDNLTTRNDGSIVSTDKTTGVERVMFADPCPIFTELDEKIPQFEKELEEKRQNLFADPSLPSLVQFIVQYARDSRLHLSYTEEDIATFVAGLGTTKLSILQGMSGTGKTSLPKIFAEALHARCEIIEVESSWRDKNELLGYYNEFSKNYTPKKFTQALYRAKLNPETLTFIVLDEMNLSRIEYYFSDFLSLMENEPDKRELRLLNVGLYRTENGEKVAYHGIEEGHNLKIPGNVWFIGTANRDESTFEISDKVYDRAHTMNFNKRAPKVTYYNNPIAQRFLPVDMLEKLFIEAKQTVNFNVDAYSVISEVEKLLAPYNISFGNRIAMQIESFVNVYCSCFAVSEAIIHEAVERILLSKVVSKLELKSVDNKEQLAAEFERLNLRKCSEFILKLNED